MRRMLIFLPLFLLACNGVVDEYGQMDANINPVFATTKTMEREVHPPEYYMDSFTGVDDPLVKVPIGDMRMVTLRFEDGSLSDELVHVMHVDRWVAAKMRLNVDPGVNPYNGGETARAVAIIISKPDFVGPYWYTTPSLQEEDAVTEGAMTIRWIIEKTWDEQDDWLYPDIPFGGF